MKIFDNNRCEFLPVENVGWRFNDVILSKYDHITLCKPTGYKCLKWHDGLKKYDEVDMYEHDYVLVDLKTGGPDNKDIEGVIEWREEIAQMLFKRLDNDRIVWLNGLYNIRKVGNILEDDDKRQDRIDSERMRSGEIS